MNLQSRKRLMQIFAPLTSGILIGISFAPYGMENLAWFALVPLAWCWKLPTQPRGAYWAAYAGGAISNWISHAWMRTSYTDGTTWFGPNSDAWLILGFIQAVSFLAMFAYGAWFVRQVKWPMAFLLPIVWVTYEFVRLLFSALFDQMGSPWGNLGMTQAGGQVFVQVADLGGVYLLSFLVAMTNGAILDGLQLLRKRDSQRHILFWGPVFAAATLAMVCIYGNWRLSQHLFPQGPSVCLMSKIDLPPYLDQQRIDEAKSAYTNCSIAQPTPARFDILLWPEQSFHHQIVDFPANVSLDSLAKIPADVRATAGPNLNTYREYVRSQLTTCAKANQATLVIGCERLQYDGVHWKRYNSIVCADRTNGYLGAYDKCYPVPWQEFLPFASSSANADSQVPYQRGTSPVVFKVQTEPSQKQLRYSIACCYDICFPSHFRKAFKLSQQREGVDFFIHCGSEGQDPTGALQEQLLRMARLRAIETRRAFVRNVSHGPSGILDSNGNWLHLATEAVISKPCAIGTIPIDRRTSGYVLWGDWPLIAISLAGAALSMIHQRKHTVAEPA